MVIEPYQNEVEGVPRDAASVVLLREADGGLEAFLLKRTGSKTIVGDAYVFPGGKLDPEDAHADAISALELPGDPVAMLGEPALNEVQAGALFVAACRETFEETGVQVKGNHLLPLSRWITPKTPAMMRRRFDTRFFVALMPDGQHAVHDGQEAKDSEWITPTQALQNYSDGLINLAPPQLMTLAGIATHHSFESLAASLRGRIPPLIEPVSFKEGEGRVIVYPGHPRHPVAERALPGPLSLVWRNNRFEPAAGFAGFFADS
ncbi:MAG: NUDIX hydrolase [Burkholderiaceae bacterium]